MKCSPISIRLTPAIRARLEERAQGRSLAEVIRTDLERYWNLLHAERLSVQTRLTTQELGDIVAAVSPQNLHGVASPGVRMATLLGEALAHSEAIAQWPADERERVRDLFMRSGQWLALADIVEQRGE